MGLCREVTTGEETFSDDGDSSKSPPEMACDCTNIVGRDHLKTKRAKKFQSSKRIQHLAQPKYYTRKYVEEETSQGKAAVEIIRTYEEQTPVRIKLLAYPQVRRLVASRNAYKGIIDKQWYGRFEDLIRRAMLTMYSRMANVQLPDKIQRANWTRADWQKHCEWLKKRALPKMEKLPSPCKPKKVPLNNLMASMFVLSQPRHPRPKYVSRCGYLSTVKFSAQRYEPTERILKLAEPKQLKKDEDEPAFEPFHVNPNALSYQPCEFTLRLLCALCKALNNFFRLQRNVSRNWLHLEQFLNLLSMMI